MKIFKYSIEILLPEIVLNMPQFADIISVQEQGGQICFWATVNPDHEIVPRKICVVGTGHEMPTGLKRFLGTVQQRGFVWHFFEMRGDA